jgi:hypothetical protein
MQRLDAVETDRCSQEAIKGEDRCGEYPKEGEMEAEVWQAVSTGRLERTEVGANAECWCIGEGVTDVASLSMRGEMAAKVWQDVSTGLERTGGRTCKDLMQWRGIGVDRKPFKG